MDHAGYIADQIFHSVCGPSAIFSETPSVAVHHHASGGTNRQPDHHTGPQAFHHAAHHSVHLLIPPVHPDYAQPQPNLSDTHTRTNVPFFEICDGIGSMSAGCIKYPRIRLYFLRKTDIIQNVIFVHFLR